MKLIILNLPRNFDEQSLALLFKKIGDIKSCDLVIDKETTISKGFGFVEMESSEAGQAAIDNLDGKDFGGRDIKVNEAKPRD